MMAAAVVVTLVLGALGASECAVYVPDAPTAASSIPSKNPFCFLILTSGNILIGG
jgi:hypothetical protein